ncbi:30S ribosomal protein S15 [Helicobacter ailurogastricus]|uniref:Small ribosomal subunit protein uS15 n=1 Tax=Helicobacter ailurogastricus TaxID=1578720 RepID=A0A0K2X9T4_9HELI|nr:30S ribosomal protein S15 [Helicobacter ailurogastricus]CRF41615.1 SSU ribosomal protein S15p (S13e) [Helicobacter ailurogastricus]CRF42607.1 SSU ribosomal protein S15p (S13e) [Helicobacter ailurogastricus]CRF44135.1 SSU ribosomal protein S15p (S13e) [Helicobacter ailurogastricus]GLH58474.1 30S ribosomal protein S15 [Helicobacter ailurogastricus]GLH59956.1 30S ribosomal protein S15 [Helicobacter ailurogastricus]
MALSTEKKQEIIKRFARQDNDTGSCEVQIALLSQRIADLTVHLKDNPKDHSSRLGLLKLVGHRKNLLKYLKNTQHDRYVELIEALGIKNR